jgi:hypothetical protein
MNRRNDNGSPVLTILAWVALALISVFMWVVLVGGAHHIGLVGK